MVACDVQSPHLRYMALASQYTPTIQPLDPPQVRFSPSLCNVARMSSFSRHKYHITSLHSRSMSPNRRQDTTVFGLSGAVTVAITASDTQLASNTQAVAQQTTTLTSIVSTSSSLASSSSTSSPGGHGPLTEVIISLTTVLGVVVTTVAVILCWIRRRRRARRQRVSLGSSRTLWPGRNHRTYSRTRRPSL